MTPRLVALATLLAALALLPGCCAPATPQAAGKVLRLALPTDPSTLDPALAVDVLSGQAVAKLHAGLVRLDPELRPVGDLAATFEVSADGRLYRFRLRDDARFSDGSPIVADDVVRSAKRLLAPEGLSQRGWIFEGVAGIDDFTAGRTAEVAGIRAPTERTVEIALDAPRGDFLPRLAMPNAAVVKEEKGGRLLGAGPFTLGEYRRGERLTLLPNPHYPGADRHLDGIELTVIKDPQATYAALEAGRIDIFNLPATLAPRFVRAPGFRERYAITSRAKLNTYYLCLNCRTGPFVNRDLRIAMNHAIDRDTILSTLLSGAAETARGPIPPALRSWAAPPPFAPDRTRAGELLAAAGFGPGNPLRIRIHFKANDEISEIVLVMKDQLAKVGIEAIPAPLEWTGLKARINAGEVECAYLNWTADYPDPRNFFHPLFYGPNEGAGGNRAFYRSEAYDRMMAEADALTDAASRAAQWEKMERHVVEDAPWVFLWHEIEHAAASRRVKGYEVPRIYALDRGCGIALE